jgi:uncharacterized protein
MAIDSMQKLIADVEDFVRDYMSKFDSSHDFSHIQRVVRLALHIANEENQKNPTMKLNIEMVHIAALLHDVNDRKYKTDKTEDISTHLRRLGCTDSEMIDTVEEIITHVSFTNECRDSESVQHILRKHPELGVLQDSDRIDACGAIGIGRLFTFGGAKNRNLDESMEHFDERLMITGTRMKTETGKQIIAERIERLKTFRTWWSDETSEV